MTSPTLFDNLFDEPKKPIDPKPAAPPLAFELSPTSWNEYVGQRHLIGPEKPIRRLIESDNLRSLILWGPPGCGKTSLSRLISKLTKANYVSLNAVTNNVTELRTLIAQAKRTPGKTILFIDEIHRFSKTQQDALLPDVETGTIVLIGATTENPYFSVIPGLVSRSQIFELNPLTDDELTQVCDHALTKTQVAFESDAKAFIIRYAKGDARKLLNILELLKLSRASAEPISLHDVQELTQSAGVSYSDDAHYDIISAFIKSIRGSDADAAIYWLARLLKQGDDPRFIARRLAILASEDVGNADPMGLVMAGALLQAVQVVGMPEIRINLAQVTTYLAKAPKSNASYLAIDEALTLVESGVIYPVPNHLRDASYPGAKKLGRGEDYKYPHNYPNAQVEQEYLPGNHRFYRS